MKITTNCTICSFLTFLSFLVTTTNGFAVMDPTPELGNASFKTRLKYSIVYPDDDSSETKKEVPNDTGSIGVQNLEDKSAAKPSAGAAATEKSADGASVASFEGYKDFDESAPENAVYDYVDTAAHEK